MARFITVTPNPAIDVTYTVADQVIGETVRVQRQRRLPGGKGINVARVLALLGQNATTLQPLGGDPGRWIAASLEQRGIPLLPLPIAGTTRTTVAVIDGRAHPTLYAEAGPSLTAEEWQRLTRTLRSALQPGDRVVVAGSFPPGTTAHDLIALIRAARDAGASILVDTSGPLLVAAANSGADHIKANLQEVTDATGLPDPVDAARALTTGGSSVLVSLGSRGALFVAPGLPPRLQEAVSGVSGNPTGAGDASTAGFVAALADGQDTGSALAWAAACGAAAVLSPIAGEIDVKQVIRLVRRLPNPPERPLPSPHPSSGLFPSTSPDQSPVAPYPHPKRSPS